MNDDELFEAEVLRISRALFAKDSPYQGSQMLEGAERDGIFVSDEAVTVIEATVSRRADKADKDGRKLLQACKRVAIEHPYKAIKGYFVTRDEPTAEQRGIIQKLGAPLYAVSLQQLRSKLVDSSEYLSLRREYPFGSARNPVNGNHVDLVRYVPQDFNPIDAGGDQRSVNVQDIASLISQGRSVVLLGDYGAGKSMALREVHLRLAAGFLKGTNPRFPLTLNLRDHQGQVEPDEAIRRHASKIGFESPSQLVRAWRAGDVTLLLDGFDEVAATGWLRKALDMRQIRRASMELVRKLIDETPTDSGLLLTGRRHFFDSIEELEGALGVRSRRPSVYSADHLDEVQVLAFMQAYGWPGELPKWLPSRPLLLGYLATTKSIEGVVGKDSIGPDEGWNVLLQAVADREARIEFGLDGSTIRRLIERLATLARATSSGVGPLYQQDLAQAFEAVCGFPPDEGSYVVLQRLPGLGVGDFTDGARFFIDEDFVDAARAGDVVRFGLAVGEDSTFEGLRGTAEPMRALGVGVAAWMGAGTGLNAGQMMLAARQVSRRNLSDALALDCLRVGLRLGDLPPITMELAELEIDEISASDSDVALGGVRFRDCVVHRLDLTEFEGDGSLPEFVGCEIGTILGAGSFSAIPEGRLVNCNVGAFDPSAKTTRGILAMPGLTARQKVLLSVLKKVYVQSGSGRKESALLRGLDQNSRALVPEVLQALVSEGLVIRSRTGGTTLYTPVRGRGGRVRSLLEQGSRSKDSILET